MGREKETKDMEKFELPDLPIAIVHCPGQEPGITMPLSVCLRLVALARATVERAAADDQKFPPPRLLGLKTLTPEEADSVIRQINENITEALESAGLEQDNEDLADRAAIEAARASGEERVPHALVKRLLAGDHPVKVYREHRGLTQVELAARTGLSAMYLSQIETGRRSGTTKTLRKIARALGVDLDDLASWDEGAETQPTRPPAHPAKRTRVKSVSAAVSKRARPVAAPAEPRKARDGSRRD
jgi:transcriptional regulator with XRE-family HTH domain